MRRSHMLVVGAIAVTAMSACGSAEKPHAEAKVATLTSTAAAAPSPSPSAERPRERLDTTPEEFEAMLGPYNKCMAEHGGSVKGSGGGQPNQVRAATKQEMDKSDAANRICEPQFFPLPPWEKDPANPEAKDFARAMVKCLKGKGVKYVEVDDDGISLALGGDRNDARSISMGLDLGPACEREVAAATK